MACYFISVQQSRFFLGKYSKDLLNDVPVAHPNMIIGCSAVGCSRIQKSIQNTEPLAPINMNTVSAPRDKLVSLPFRSK